MSTQTINIERRSKRRRTYKSLLEQRISVG